MKRVFYIIANFGWKKTILLVLLALSNFIIKGQGLSLDSLDSKFYDVASIENGINTCENWEGNDVDLLNYAKSLHAITTKNFRNTALYLKTASCLANAYYYNDSIDQSTRCLEMAVSSATPINRADTFFVGFLLNDLGLNYHYSGRDIDAKASLNRAITFLTAVDSLKELSDAISNLGFVYHSEGDYQEAVTLFSKANTIDTQLDDNYRTSSSLNSLGRIYVDWGKYETGLDYYLRSVELLDTTNQKPLLAVRYNNIGMVFQKMNQYNDAMIWFRKALQIEEQYGVSKRLAIRYGNMGNALLNLNKYEESEEYLLSAIGILEKTNAENLKSKIYGLLGQLYLAKAEEAKAKNYFILSISSAEKSGLPEQSAAYELTYNYYKKTGDYKTALDYLERYKQAKDSIFNIEASKQVQRLEALYQSKQKETEIMRLESENEMQQQTIAYNRKQRNTAILVVILVLIVLVLLFRLFTTVRKQREVLKMQNEKLDSLNNTLNSLFGIISHDLKGATASYQSTAKIIAYHLDKKQPEKLAPLTSEIQKNASNLTDMLNHLLEWANMQLAGTTVQPTNIDLETELVSLSELYQRSAELKGNRLNLTVEDELKIHCDKESFRLIVRNLVSNAIKFSSEGVIDIEASSLPDKRAKITVSDTGCGMPDELTSAVFDIGKAKVRKGTRGEKGTGLGLVMVAEHVEKNEGEITLKSEINKGTTVSVILNKSIE
jgi:signal transduction histidine kinase